MAEAGVCLSIATHFFRASNCRNALAPGDWGGRVLSSPKSQEFRSLSRKSRRDCANLSSNPGLTGRSRVSESLLPSPISLNRRSENLWATRCGGKENGAKAIRRESAKKPATRNSCVFPKFRHQDISHSGVENVVASG